MDSPHCSAETLSALLDGELTAIERARATAHADRCPACSARLSAALRLDTGLRDAATLPCASVFPGWSAVADGEATPSERSVVEAHLAGCGDCRARSAALVALDARLAGLPAGRPSAETDRRIAQLGRPKRTALRTPVTIAWRTALAVLVAIGVVGGATWTPGGAPSADHPTIDQPLVAAIQRVVFDGRTNTLYVLDIDRAEVTAIDATTQAERARVSVGGRPSALALNPAANTLLVLDASDKRLTEIDATRNTVVSASSLDITGTPTSLQVDVNGKIVVSSVAARVVGPAPTQSAVAATGHVTIFDATTKQVEAILAVDVAPQQVVLDPRGLRALLISADSTTLADASTFKTVARLPGGIAAAFDVTGQGIAILSADPAGSRVTVNGGSATVSVALIGAPVTMIAMPGGGFAVLLDVAGHGLIEVLDRSGQVSTRVDTVLAGRDLTFDPASGRFAVGGASGGTVAFTGAAPVADASPSLAPAASGTTPSPAPSATDARKPSASPAPLAAAVAGLPPLAALGANGTYRLALPNGRQPALVAGSGSKLWFVDLAKRLATIDTATGAVADVAQLPFDGGYSRLLVGATHVFAIDQTNGRLAVVSTASGRIETIGFPFLSFASGFALGADDKFWAAGGEATSALAFAPETKAITAIDLKTSGITALTVDSAGRVWFAGDASGSIGVYDQFRKSIGRIPLGQQGTVTALAVDGAGALWAGTSSGDLINVWLGVAGVRGTAGGPVRGLVADPTGTVWSYASAPGSLAFRAVPAGAVRLQAAGATSLTFDAHGRAWLGDPGAGAFYIVVDGG